MKTIKELTKTREAIVATLDREGYKVGQSRNQEFIDELHLELLTFDRTHPEVLRAQQDSLFRKSNR